MEPETEPDPLAAAAASPQEASGAPSVGGAGDNGINVERSVVAEDEDDLAKCRLPAVSIVVEAPSMAGNALNRHVVYRVRSTLAPSAEEAVAPAMAEDFEVMRRFSEFETLRNALVQRYPGLLIPPIPAKTVQLSTADAKLMRSRTRILALFVERLATLPWVADDAVLRGFLTEGTAAWATKAAAVSEDGGAERDVVIHTDESTTLGKGRAMWFAAVERAPLPPEFDRFLADLLGRIEALAASHDVAAKAVAKATAAALQRTETLGAVLDGFSPWRGESARWSAQLNANSITERAASTVHGALRTYRAETSLEAPTLDLVVSSALQWQALQLQAMRDLVARRMQLGADLAKAKKAKATLEALKAAGKSAPAVGAQEQMRRFSDKTKGFFGGLGKKHASNDDASSKSSSNNSSSSSSSSSIFPPSALGMTANGGGGGGGGSSSSSSSSPGVVTDMDESIFKARALEEEASRALDHHLKALCYSEFERFDAEHAALTELFARRLFSAHKELASRLVAGWNEALDALGDAPPTKTHAPVVAAPLVFDVASLINGTATDAPHDAPAS